MLRNRLALATAALTAAAGWLGTAVQADHVSPRTPVKHLIVLFQENRSFDHYFGTYPKAMNLAGEPAFHARRRTPAVNGFTDDLLFRNPNKVNPIRLGPGDAVECSQTHVYKLEQQAADYGLMDKFVENNGATGNQGVPTDETNPNCDPNMVMGYFDGNTVTAMWNWAQRFSMSDNSWGTTYGPSTPGALNLVAGQTAGAVVHTFSGTKGPTGQLTDGVHNTTLANTFYVGPANPVVMTDVVGFAKPLATQTGTLVTDLDPYLDDCGADKGGTVASQFTVELTGKNIGDLLNEKGVTWGWFAGGFRTASKANPVTTDKTNPMAGVSNDPFGITSFGGAANDGQAQNVGTPNFTPAVCAAAHVLHPDATTSFDGTANVHPVRTDYNPHHSPFQYYASTRNPHHLPPSSVAMIGRADQANHQYDLLDFYAALKAGRLPAVSFLKAINRDDGHPGGESDPLAEQRFLVQTINLLQQSPEWESTAVFIAWDDSDGWYDHAAPPLLNPSAATGFDAAGGAANGSICGTPKRDAIQGRCGLGPRLVLNLVSPWSKVNYVDHSLTDQASILRFIEDNWDLNYIDGPATHDPNNHLRKSGFPLAPQKQSFDVITGSFDNMFDDEPHRARFFLDPVTGTEIRGSRY
jgi:phospholipase C